ncbi:MAG: hypothetical protein JXA37_11670 [Chloroflexia bacterium]|nr:hypothetical protein [Chloroflexia bacterium]
MSETNSPLDPSQIQERIAHLRGAIQAQEQLRPTLGDADLPLSYVPLKNSRLEDH